MADLERPQGSGADAMLTGVVRWLPLSPIQLAGLVSLQLPKRGCGVLRISPHLRSRQNTFIPACLSTRMFPSSESLSRVTCYASRAHRRKSLQEVLNSVVKLCSF